jgi:hypothetical protein
MDPFSNAPTEEQKRHALRRVIESRTFSRSEQLRKLLAFLCEAEIRNQGHRLTEYIIGIDALGRSPDFSPVEDTVVRNRAHALRQKLDEYYTSEGQRDEFRIQVPKGSYKPRFTRAETSPAQLPALARTARTRFIVVASAAALALFIAGWFTGRARSPSPVAGPMEAIWGPILHRDAEVLICVGTPAHLLVREYPAEALRQFTPPLVAMPEQFLPWYRQRHPSHSGYDLFLMATHNSPLWGDAVGAGRVMELLGRAGARAELMPERILSLPAIRNKNLVLFGRPEYSPAVERVLEKAPLTIHYDTELREEVVSRRPLEAPAGVTYVSPARRRGEAVSAYGLVTVLPSEGTNGGHRTVVFSGTNSAGTQAAVEYFTSSHHLRDLLAKLKQVPSAYQVVVETSADSTIAITPRLHSHQAFSR